LPITNDYLIATKSKIGAQFFQKIANIFVLRLKNLTILLLNFPLVSKMYATYDSFLRQRLWQRSEKPVQKTSPKSTPTELIISYIQTGSTAKVKEIIGKHPHVIKDDNILLAAVSSGKVKLVKYIINKGCKLTKGNIGKVADAAVQCVDSKMFEYIVCVIPKFVDLPTKLLESAVKRHNFGVIKCLVKLGFDPKPRSRTLFRMWSHPFFDNGLDIQMINYLLDLGCDPKSNSDILLMGAAQERDLDLIKRLIGLGCNRSILADVTRFWSDSRASFEMIKYLVNTGSKLTRVNLNTLQTIIDQNCLDMLDFLIDKANCLSDGDLHYSILKSIKNDKTDFFEYLICRGTNIPTFMWRDLFNWAHKFNTIFYTRLLVQANLDVNYNIPSLLSYLDSGKFTNTVQYSFCLLTKKNKLKYLECRPASALFQRGLGSVDDVLTESKNKFVNETIFNGQLRLNNSQTKNKWNFLKQTLKPTSLFIQMVLL
jgi:hypothetical protein